jgi:sugar phosphate isomerase/epimerase
MLKPAFSTVACPEWTLTQVADRALELGFEAVELRTFGDASRSFACDPALTSEEKVRAIFRERGVEPLVLGTGVRFDEPIWPPVFGVLGAAAERSVREGKRAIDLAVGIECPFVRVFGYEHPPHERRAGALRRITDRLRMAIDHADKSGVRVVLENGGSFSTSAELLEIIETIDSPLLGASYSSAVGIQCGEDPAEAIRDLGDKLWVARIKDAKDGRPCFLGEGDLACRDFMRNLASAGFDGPLVFEWDRAWIDGLAPAEEALGHASRTMWGWLGANAQRGKVASNHAGERPSPRRIRS